MRLSKYLLLFILHRCLCVDLTYYVKEGKSPGTYLGDIAADTHLIDSVPPKNHNLITFSQLQQGTMSSQLFRVSKDRGKLYTTQILDAETMCKREKECFQMMDIAIQKGTSFVKLLEIKVVIQDVNDHQPEFLEKQVNIEFSEDMVMGTKRSIPNAIDRDIGVINSQITYQLKKNKDEPFKLLVSKSVDGTSELDIILEDKLDREAKDTYIIQVIAKDKGSPPKQSVLDVHIAITDVNDNPPVFTQNVYNVSVNNELGSIPVLILSANDLDSGENGWVSYHLSSKTSDTTKSHFELNEETGEIFLHKKFTLGQELVHKLYVEATDRGKPPLSSTAKILVNVINQQNNPPNIDINFVFASTRNATNISENIEVGSFIAFVKVTDHDTGQNGEISCDLHHDKFQLQSLGIRKYKVILNSPVDREFEDHHDITISCQDKGSPPIHSESTFSINVMDVNDVKPQFSKDTYKFRIQENQKSKIPVGFINATDPDLGPGGKLTYSLWTKNKHFLPFKIADDGLISTISSLDHELHEIYEFQVFAKDNGIPSLNNTVNVIVEVQDENDNSPYFTYPSVNPFTLDLVYYPYHTKNITVLKASDRDNRENAFLKYEITAGNEKQLFTINHYTGLLSFTRVVNQQDAGSYDLEFIVKDSGTPVLSAKTTMFLTLTVSNKTSERSNVVHIKTDEKIHLNLVIIITLISVTVSVIITAFMSICILRYCNQRSLSQEEEMNHPHRCASKQRHLSCPSYHASPWPEDQDKFRNPHLMSSKRESLPEDEFSNGHRSSMQKPASTDMAHHIYIHEVTQNSGGEKHEKCTSPGNNPWKSTKSSYSDNGHIWSQSDTGQGGEIPDLFTTQYCNSPSSQIDQFHKADTRPLEQTFSYPSDMAISAKCFYKPNNEQDMPWTSSKSATIDCGASGSHSQLRNLPVTSCRTSYPRPLPPVPNLPN